MRKALRDKAPSNQQTAIVRTVTSPVKGWNARDPIAGMDPQFAFQMDNVLPRSADVVLRNGCQDGTTGISGTVKSLMPYGASKLFGANDVGIYDVTASGAVGAAVATITNGQIVSENFVAAGTNYLYCVNGVDKPQLYTGAAWVAVDGASTPAITGLTTTNIAFIKAFKQRLWFIQKNSTSLWYLASGAIGGALTEFPVGNLLSKGGTLVACADWTFDGGKGPDDYFAIVSSEGELIVYQGTDPSSASTFSLIGVFYIGAPLGKKCFTKFGGDLLYICAAGAFPLSKMLMATTIDRSISVTSNIDNAFLNAAFLYGSAYGWEATLYPTVNLLIVNVPQTADGSYCVQYVMNMVTGGWCRFTGWVASCFAVFKGKLYFGTVGKTVQAYTGTGDYGTNVIGEVRQAYNYFIGGDTVQKHCTMIRPIMQVSDSIGIAVGIDTDFVSNSLLSIPGTSSSGFAEYDVDSWDLAVWAPDVFTQKSWKTVACVPGFALSLHLKIVTATVNVTWLTTDFMLKLGRVL